MRDVRSRNRGGESRVVDECGRAARTVPLDGCPVRKVGAIDGQGKVCAAEDRARRIQTRDDRARKKNRKGSRVRDCVARAPDRDRRLCPAPAISDAGIWARSCLLLRNVVKRSEPFHLTVDSGRKFEPYTCRSNAGPPTTAEVGLMATIAGVGLGRAVMTERIWNWTCTGPYWVVLTTPTEATPG